MEKKIRNIVWFILIVSIISIGCTRKQDSINKNIDKQDLIEEGISEDKKEKNVKEDEIIIEDDSTKKEVEEKKYKDGVYSGKHKAIGVNVTIENSKISNIEITRNKQTKGYYEEVLRRLPKEIIQKQSIEVEGVTGSTSSSNNLKEAVNNALKEAEVVK